MSELMLYNTELTGDINDICRHFETGLLRVVRIDAERVACQCCENDQISG